MKIIAISDLKVTPGKTAQILHFSNAYDAEKFFAVNNHELKEAVSDGKTLNGYFVDEDTN